MIQWDFDCINTERESMIDELDNDIGERRTAKERKFRSTGH